MIHVLGHTNPDTDAIISAIIYAKFLNLTGTPATPFRLGEINNETRFVLELLGWDMPQLIHELPSGSKVALTDHNEITQTIINITDLDVVSIIDHHKFNFQTSQPINILVRPIASTCSVLYGLWIEHGLEISKDIALAMMTGIISDTLYFRSPTTTSYDKDIFVKLTQITQISNPEQLSLDMFNAKSDLGNISVRDLVTIDYKVFESNNKKIGIGVIETTNPGYSLERKNEIIQDLLTLKQEQGLEFIMLCIIDILEEKNTTIVASSEDGLYIQQIFGVSTVDNTADLGNRISRKKQLAGPATEFFA